MHSADPFVPVVGGVSGRFPAGSHALSRDDVFNGGAAPNFHLHRHQPAHVHQTALDDANFAGNAAQTLHFQTFKNDERLLRNGSKCSE